MTVDITIVGLGPGPAELRTVAVQRALDGADHIFIRCHQGVMIDDMMDRPNVTDLAPFRDSESATPWHRAVDAVIASARLAPIVLAIPGHPRFGESLVRGVLTKASEIGLTSTVLDGVSTVDALASALDADLIGDRVQFVSGWNLAHINDQTPFDGGLLRLSPALPVLVTHLYSRDLMTACAAQLLRAFPAEHAVELVDSAGLPEEKRQILKLGDLAGQPGGSMVAVYVPSLSDLEATRTATTLQHIVARLRRPDGCPWDREQTFTKLVPDLVEEVYEVVDAIAANDMSNLAEELGDVTLLVTMLAQIAEEAGAFRLEDVYDGVATKIVRRHPHVFGDGAVASANDVLGVWARVKEQEHKHSPKPEKAADGLPHSMPRLQRSVEILAEHPLPVHAETAADRERALLQALSDIIAAGDDPNTVLTTALSNHTTTSASRA